jgi:hypothetical protein
MRGYGPGDARTSAWATYRLRAAGKIETGAGYASAPEPPAPRSRRSRAAPPADNVMEIAAMR